MTSFFGTTSYGNYYARFSLKGLSDENLRTLYCQWMLGLAPFWYLREKRQKSGIPSYVSLDGVLKGSSIHGRWDFELISKSIEGCFVARLRHRDDTDTSLFWNSLIRITNKDGTCLVEHAARCTAPQNAVKKYIDKPPAIIRHLFKLRNVVISPDDIVQPKPFEIRVGEVEAFVNHVLLKNERSPCLVVTRENESNECYIDMEIIKKRLVSSAFIAVLENKEASREFVNVLKSKSFKREFSCFDGGVRLYFPDLKPEESPYRHPLWTRQALREKGRESTTWVAREVISRIELETIPSHFWNAIEELNREEKRRLTQSLIDLKIQHSEVADRETQAVVNKLEGVVTDLQTQLAKQIEEADAYALEAQQEAEARKAKEQEMYQVEQRNSELLSALDSKRVSGSKRLDPTEQKSVMELASNPDKVTLTSALIISALMFADEIAILKSAFNSADGISENDGILADICLLATKYRNSMIAGEGDRKAGEVFGKRFAPTESESTISNSEARKQRIFQFEGEDLLMDRHLKFGKKNNLRLHFYWHPKKKIIVIGSCGDHLKLSRKAG